MDLASDSHPPDHSKHEGHSPRCFATTRWSVVLAAGKGTSADAERALEELCRTYWYHVYAYVRRKGHAHEDATDLTQEFFSRLLEWKFFGAADPLRGRFRTFLLTALERFLVNEWNAARRKKRGGGRKAVPLEVDTAEARYSLEPADRLTAERIFERRWALTLLEDALARLGMESVAAGRSALFEAVRSAVAGDGGEESYADVAAKLGMSEGSVKTSVHRLRRRYGELLRSEIAQTVASPEDIDDEIRHLFEALAT